MDIVVQKAVCGDIHRSAHLPTVTEHNTEHSPETGVVGGPRSHSGVTLGTSLPSIDWIELLSHQPSQVGDGFRLVPIVKLPINLINQVFAELKGIR